MHFVGGVLILVISQVILDGRRQATLELLTMIRVSSAAVAAIVAMVSVAPSARAQWLNETGVAGEADFVNLQFPATLSVQAAQPTPFVYGQIYDAAHRSEWRTGQRVGSSGVRSAGERSARGGRMVLDASILQRADREQ
jgi:hypothetical protein